MHKDLEMRLLHWQDSSHCIRCHFGTILPRHWYHSQVPINDQIIIILKSDNLFYWESLINLITAYDHWDNLCSRMNTEFRHSAPNFSAANFLFHKVLFLSSYRLKLMLNSFQQFSEVTDFWLNLLHVSSHPISNPKWIHSFIFQMIAPIIYNADKKNQEHLPEVIQPSCSNIKHNKNLLHQVRLKYESDCHVWN
jgi:hypothetical protein